MGSNQLLASGAQLKRYLGGFTDCFARSEPLEHLLAYVSGQLSDLRRKSIGPMAEAARIPPRTLQQFLSRHVWDEEFMLDTLQRIVAREPQHRRSIGVIDQSCHPKKGDNTPGVDRQWCSTTGRIVNCAVTVHLAYAAGDFHCLLDGELFLPESWAEDRARCRSVGIADEMAYRPKWQIAVDMCRRAVANGVQIQWLAFDQRYGRFPEFLCRLGDWGQSYVAEVPETFTGWLMDPKFLPKGRHQSMAWPPRHWRSRFKTTPAECVERLCRRCHATAEGGWKKVRIKDGSKERIGWQAMAARFWYERHGSASWPHLLIFARNSRNPAKIRYFVSNAREGTAPATLLDVAFEGERVERCFQDEKNRLGLSDFEVRGYLSLRRHLILTAVSHLFLARTQHTRRGQAGP